MPAMLETFDDLVRAAREQALRQRFLLVFARAVLPDDAGQEERARFRSGQGGALEPVMYADKGEHEVSDFRSLVAEARHVGATLGGSAVASEPAMPADWDLVLVGCLGGSAVEEPAQKDVQAALGNILRAMRAGEPLGNLIAFDRDGRPVQFV